MNWTLAQLRAFLAVSESGSMTAAADLLGYTTGAVSQQIAALERAIGERLFLRAGRMLEPTDAARSLVPHARDLLDAERRAQEAVSPTARRAVVRIGVFGSAARFAIPAAIQVVRSVDAPLDIEAHETRLDEMPGAVLAGRLDIALTVSYTGAESAPDRGLQVTALLAEDFALVLPPSAPLLTGDAEELVAYCNKTDWILPPPQQPFGRSILLACAKAGIDPRVRHVVDETALALALTESGVGITIATPLMLALRRPRAILRELPVPAGRTISALTRRVVSPRMSVDIVLGVLSRAFADLGEEATVRTR